jgi:Ras-related protein Rab-1A
MGNNCGGVSAVPKNNNQKDGIVVGSGNNFRPQNHLFKFLIIGDAGVGKTSLAAHWIDGNFASAYIATIGVDFKVKKIDIDGTTVKIQVWDTAGQERYNTITSTYYRGCHGVIVVYDVTDRQSFLNVKKWIGDIEKYTESTSDLTVLLVANKCDQETRRVVPLREANEFCKYKQFLMPDAIEASAKTGQNVDKAFMDLAQQVYQKFSTN